MGDQRHDDQLEHTYSSSLPIQDVTLKTCWKQWAIENCGEKGSEISVLIARYDDDDDIHLVPLLSSSDLSGSQTSKISHIFI